MKVLVTGGAGYIGSTTAKALEEAGHTPVILDSLLTGPHVFVGDRIFYEGDIADRALLARIVEEHPDLDATIHMAARIVVPESVQLPYEYYRDNVAKSLELFDALHGLGQRRVIFSSTGSLYAAPAVGFEVRWDVARAHVRVVEQFDDVVDRVGQPSVVMNLGRGEGVSVRELVAAFERVLGHEVPLREAPPRLGDAVGSYANVDRIAELTGWRAEHDI